MPSFPDLNPLPDEGHRLEDIPVFEPPRSPTIHRCHVCGSDAFQWGNINGQHALRFKRDGGGVLQKYTVFGGETVRGRKCNLCGNVQLFVQ